MLGCDGDEARAEQRVGPRGEHVDAVFAADQIEGQVQALTFADPVFLHQPDLLRPLVEGFEAFEQFIGKVCDLEEPLVQFLLFNQRAGPPAASVDHLFIGEHGHVDRVPIDRRFLAIDEAGLVHVEEQRLLLPIIFGLAGGQLTRPVNGEAKALELLFHRLDIGARPISGMDLLFHRRIFSRHAKAVPAHRVEHGMAGHPLIARQHIAHRIVADMAHMDAPAGIGEHLQHIGLGARVAGRRGGEDASLLPNLLPMAIGLKGVEARAHKINSLNLGRECPAQ